MPLLVLVLVVLGCGTFWDEVGSAETIFASTDVGTPEGDKVSKDIGPEGGTLASPDGRLTLTVPPDALTETIPFSIQPITNKAGNGIGQAYRLEPDGKAFTTPLEIRLRYDEKDLDGTVPDALMIAYQDQNGSWRGQTTAKLDQTAKTLTISTTHFTDFAFLARIRMSPVNATVYVGNGQLIRLVTCRELSFIERLRGVDPRDACTSAPKGNSNKWKLTGEGTLTDDGEGVMYTAPAKKPSPNTTRVDHTLEFEVRDVATGRLSTVQATFRTVITIISRGYRASGQNGSVVYSGVICELEEPFSATGSHPLFSFPFKFVPTSAVAGTMSYVTGASGISAAGTGTYTIEGADTENPRILVNSRSTASIATAKDSGGGLATINLTPLETDECGVDL